MNVFGTFSLGLCVFGLGLSAAAQDGFMSESWSQKRPANDLMPRYLTEADAGDDKFEEWNGRAPTGCVATQMAQLMHFWQWPKRYERFFESAVPQSVAVEDKGRYQIVLQANGQVPYVFDGSDLTKARLSLLAATLGGLDFNRNGTGGHPSVVATQLASGMNASKTYYDYDGTDKDWKVAPKLLNAGFLLPATVPGHAIVIQGWKEDAGEVLVYRINGEGGAGDGWVSLKTIEEVFLFYPRMRVQLDRLPSHCTGELSVSWSFPEPYMRLYPTELTGFRLTATSRASKGEATLDVTVGREVRNYEVKLRESGEYDIAVTPLFAGGLVKHTVTEDTATVCVSASAVVEPRIEQAPKRLDVGFGMTNFTVVCSKSVESLDLHPGILTIHEAESFSMEAAMSVDRTADGVFAVSLDATKLPTRFNHQQMLLTLEAKDRNWVADYVDVLVEFTTSGTDSPDSGTDPVNPGTDPVKLADYILISPKDFVADWTKYVENRKIAHSELTFAVKNAAEIYTDYKGDSPSEQVKAFIAEQVTLGAKYIVLGAAWSDSATIEKSEESFVVPGQYGDKYDQLALSLDNTIPGFFKTFDGKTQATDYPYALVDGDEKPDVVIARIPLVPWPKADGSVATFSEMIAGYGQKVATVESAAFAGTHRYACAGAQLGTTVARGSEYWPTERHAYADGYYDFFDPRHPDSATDGMIAARRRFRDFFAMYNPVKGAMVIPMGNAATDFFDDKAGWEAIVAKCHGLEGEAYQTGITDARFRETETLVKFGIFAMPCLTGRPDRTTTWNGWKNLRYPSMGVAAIGNPHGGEVVGFHNTHDGAGKNDVALVTTNGDPYATQYEGFLLEALFKDRLSAGDAWREAHAAYIDKCGTGTWHLWTVYESLLYGDPLVIPSAVNEPVCGKGAVAPKVLFR